MTNFEDGEIFPLVIKPQLCNEKSSFISIPKLGLGNELLGLGMSEKLEGKMDKYHSYAGASQNISNVGIGEE
ncbi:MAG: hypothetical protein H8D42_03215 [Candidatus Marinimicrobia bacterium]|nr:hypothetical protein [Candidatus Neomarinimicrobiota bacterium]MBL7067541.1 hypothetical protein [Candidatus Neomarinimicrobiota bacterium]